MKKIVILLLLLIGINALAFDNKGIIDYKTMFHYDINKICNDEDNVNTYANIIIGNVRTYTPYISYSELNKNNILSELAYKKAPEYCKNYLTSLVIAGMKMETDINIKSPKTSFFGVKNQDKKEDSSFGIRIIFGIIVIIGVFLYYRRIINDSKTS